MFISHDYKFIFVKTRKTAGSSIEKFFLDKLQGTDFIFSGMSSENLPSFNCSFKNAEHNGSKFIKHHYPKEWKKYFKFTIERNPWDKIVSRYYWQKYFKPKKINVDSFESYLKNYQKDIKKASDYPLYTLNNKIAVNYVMRYENLYDDLEHICKKINLTYNNELKSINLKGNHRTRNVSYQQYYTEKSKNLIADFFSKEIDYFNYQF